MLAWLAFIWMCDLFNTLSTGRGGGGGERSGGRDRVLSLQSVRVFFFFFPCVCENAKRAAPYNGGVTGEAVRGASAKEPLGSAWRRTSRRSSFVSLGAAVRSRRAGAPTWRRNAVKQGARDLQLRAHPPDRRF